MLFSRPDIVGGKVYRGKKKNEADDEMQSVRELQAILNSKNRKQCDCEAQVHDLMENCLICGRLSCTFEGPGKCFHCGNLILSQEQRTRLGKHIDVLQVVPVSSDVVNRGQALSTKVIDDQFDYTQSKKHLRLEDRMRLAKELDELQNKRHQTKLKLEVDIDNLQAGSVVVAEIDDYEQELTRLETSSRAYATDGGSRMSLHELVHRENKRNYAFQYKSPLATPRVIPEFKARTSQHRSKTKRNKDHSNSNDKNI